MTRLLKSPFLHFIVLGFLLFLALRGSEEIGTSVDDVQDPHRIEVDVAEIALLEQRFATRTRRAPNAEEARRILDRWIEEEILFREAVARGLLERDGGVQARLMQKMLFLEGQDGQQDPAVLLDRAVELNLHQGDLVVRRILVQKMKLIGSTLSDSEKVKDAEVAAAYEAERESLREADRVDMTHIFASRDARGESTRADAVAMQSSAQVLGIRSIEDAIALGDAFPLGHRLNNRSARQLTRSFGLHFGDAVLELDPGRWSEPIASAYGHHIVLVEDREAGQIPPLEEVATRLRQRIEQSRRDAKLTTLLNELRTRYEIVSAPPGSGHPG